MSEGQAFPFQMAWFRVSDHTHDTCLLLSTPPSCPHTSVEGEWILT